MSRKYPIDMDVVGTDVNVATATKLATPRNINGTPFDGSADINPAAAAADVARSVASASTDSILAGKFRYVARPYEIAATGQLAIAATGCMEIG